MKKALSILLTAVMLISLFAILSVTADAAIAESYIASVKRVELPYYTASGKSAIYMFTVPKITVQSEYADTINEKLLSHCNTQITRFEYAYNHKIAITPDIGYRCYLSGDILCVMLYTNNFNMDNYSEWEYKINVRTGERVYNSDVLAIAGVTRTEADQKLISLIKTELSSGRGTGRAYYAQYGEQYSDKIIKELVPSLTHYYLDNDGALLAMVYDCWKWDDVQVGYCLSGAVIQPGSQPCILGDADGDGVLSVMDATAIQRKLAKISVKSYDEKAADADEDGNVTVLDATAIQRCLAKLPTHQGIGEPKK